MCALYNGSGLHLDKGLKIYIILLRDRLLTANPKWASSSVGERFLDTEEVGSSILLSPTIERVRLSNLHESLFILGCSRTTINTTTNSLKGG